MWFNEYYVFTGLDNYGGKWRKLKGAAMVRLRNGKIRKAELHWYETHGIGKKKSNVRDT